MGSKFCLCCASESKPHAKSSRKSYPCESFNNKPLFSISSSFPVNRKVKVYSKRVSLPLLNWAHTALLVLSGLKKGHYFTWKKRIMFHISPRTKEGLPSAISAASMLTSLTCGEAVRQLTGVPRRTISAISCHPLKPVSRGHPVPFGTGQDHLSGTLRMQKHI